MNRRQQVQEALIDELEAEDLIAIPPEQIPIEIRERSFVVDLIHYEATQDDDLRAEDDLWYQREYERTQVELCEHDIPVDERCYDCDMNHEPVDDGWE